MKRNLLFLLHLALVTGCLEKQVKESPVQDASLGAPKTEVAKIFAPSSFQYSMTRTISIETFLYHNGKPLNKVAAAIYDDKKNLLQKVITDEKGKISTSLRISRTTSYLLVKPLIIGLDFSKRINLSGSTSQFSFKAEKIILKLLNIILPAAAAADTVPSYRGGKKNIKFLANSIDDNGVPNNIIKDFEEISIEFLKRIDSSLPERKPVPEFHPQFITDGINTNIELNEEADVWITFLHEGAGYKNTMGFFTYPTNNPPLSPDEIDELFIVFPNMSLKNSGGGLEAGDTVHLGRYSAGTSIGYFIMANSWDPSKKKNYDGLNTFYSVLSFNTNESADFKHHNVLIWDEEQQKVVIGFEDLFRSSNGSDEDFNDAVFYVTTNPGTAVLTDNIAPIDNIKDDDNDGIENQYDDYPEDALRAFNNYFPLEKTQGTLLFEDLWPYQGDYDFNDLVLGYHFNYITNSKGEVKEIIGNFKIRATGASLSNGVALMLDIPFGDIESVKGNLITEDYITLNSNGTEAGLDHAVIILCDNINNYMPKFSNVFSGMNLQPYEFSVEIILETPSKIGLIGFPPYKPFLIKDMNRALEIHQMDFAPTQKFKNSYLTRGDDRSSSSEGRFFRNKENMPWVLNIPYEIPHPKEKIPIFNAFKEFAPWAKSGGSFYSKWYEDNNEKIDNNKVIKND